MNIKHPFLPLAVDTIRAKWTTPPQLGIILGTGSGGVAKRLQVDTIVNYEDVPGFVKATATGHRGHIFCGSLAGIPAIAMQGRFHRYEGWSFEQTVFPTRLMIELGIQGLVVTNAAGGVDPKMCQGDLIFINSHIDLLTYWAGTGLSSDLALHSDSTDLLNQRPFPRGDAAYCPRWMGLAQERANRLNITARPGVYVALPGPNYETRAEYRLIRKIGGDVVGMSTVSEVAVAAQANIPVLGISIVTNVARPDALEKTSGDEVVHAARDVESVVADLIEASSKAYFLR